MASRNNERAKRAVEAMKPLGFSRKLTVEVLKRLVSVYSSNWVLIEDDNYRVLADAILDAQENAGEEENCRSKEPVQTRAVNNHFGACEPGPSSSKSPRPDLDREEQETETGAGLILRKRLRKNSTIEKRAVINGTEQREIVPVTGTVQREIVPPFPTEQAQRSTQVGTSQTGTGTSTVIDHMTGGIITYQKVHVKKKKSNENKMALKEPKIEPGTETEMLNNVHSADNRGNQMNQDSMNLHLGSSKNGQIKLAFQFLVFNNNISKPNLDNFFESLENRYLESFNDFRILKPGFSVRGFMNEMCELTVEEMKP